MAKDFLSQIEPSTKRKISGATPSSLVGKPNRKLTGESKPPSLRSLRSSLVPGSGVRSGFSPKASIQRRRPRD